MGHKDCTYVVFDGDNDMWAWGYMKGWNALPTVQFDFDDAHDLRNISDNASEAAVKAALRGRFDSSRQVVVLVGKHTRYLYRFVRWEIETALDLDLPIVVSNLNDKRQLDDELCPPILREAYAVHVSFEMKIISHALDHFPSEHSARDRSLKGPRHYEAAVYQNLGL